MNSRKIAALTRDTGEDLLNMPDTAKQFVPGINNPPLLRGPNYPTEKLLTPLQQENLKLLKKPNPRPGLGITQDVLEALQRGYGVGVPSMGLWWDDTTK